MYTFDYSRPMDLQALEKLSGQAAQYLAGGQSLVQAMKLRLAQPEHLVDLAALPELQGISRVNSVLRIGAMVTHAHVADSAMVQGAIPALSQLARGIGDPMVRSQGTLGGALANADPAACYPSAVLALNATVITSLRRIPAAEFFRGLYETALGEQELLIAVEFPIAGQSAYAKLSHPASRFALVGVFVSRDSSNVRVAVTGAKSCVYRDASLEAALASNFSPEAIAGVEVSSAQMNEDIHCSASYRAAMVLEMTKRAVAAILADV